MNYRYDPNLVLYLPLGELDGASIQDQSAYGHTCAVTEATLYPGRGRYFDGVNDQISVPDASSLDITNDITIIMGINADGWGESGNAGYIFEKQGAYAAYLDSGGSFKVQLTGVTSTDFDSTSGVTLNNDLQLAFTRREVNGDVNLYVNGVLTKYISGGTESISTSANILRIGDRAASDRCFQGLIRLLVILNRVLNPMEVQSEYLEAR